ncbi:MAG: ribonuclease R [Phycisphaeraceae bacterium]
MSEQRYSRRILAHLAQRRYEPRTIQQLAEDLNIPDEQYEVFRQAVTELLDEGQVVLDTEDTIVLPPPGPEMTGIFRKHERGFGFLVPDDLVQHGDLFVPPGETMDAMTGDRVRAKVRHERRRAGEGKSPYTGRIVEVLQRADKHYVGELFTRGKQHYVQVDGRVLHDPVVIRDPHAKNARVGDKVVVELVDFPDKPGELPEGVITEVLGEAGEPDVETLSVIRAYGLEEKFSKAVLDEARQAARSFDDEHVPEDRTDLTELFICTIDPPDARDFDDAISIRRLDDGEDKADGWQPAAPPPKDAAWELGVHIADVAHFVAPGSPLDAEAYERGNSTYLPRRVLPMLPELLSNGVCSLQEGVNRFAKSCFIYYDEQGKPLDARFARSVIRSAKRLTYLEAQALIDGDLRAARKHAAAEANYPKQLARKLKRMDELARTIFERRMKQGMIRLDLPEVELVFDDAGRVVDAQKEDDAFTHTIIEMFMVEANEAAARLFDALRVPMVRRVHPDPDQYDVSALRSFARVAGFNIPQKPSRKELQQLLEQVRGKPAQHAVHLAVLKTLSKAEYSPTPIGHFALASEHYTHFTSPIRRYPDLIVHRGLDAYVEATDQQDGGRRGKSKQIARQMTESERVPDEDRLHELGRHCSNTERNSESAERELRTYLVLELLNEHLGEDFEGTVTGVTNAGVYIEIERYLVDGMVRSEELPGSKQERWRLNPNTGALVAQRSGQSITIGDRFLVRIANIDLARRQMDLTIIEPLDTKRRAHGETQAKPKKKKKSSDKRRQPKGAREAHQKTQKIKQQKGAQSKSKRTTKRKGSTNRKRNK